jgi:hypothetical protein
MPLPPIWRRSTFCVLGETMWHVHMPAEAGGRNRYRAHECSVATPSFKESASHAALCNHGFVTQAQSFLDVHGNDF